MNSVSIVVRLSTLQSVHYQRFHCILKRLNHLAQRNGWLADLNGVQFVAGDSEGHTHRVPLHHLLQGPREVPHVETASCEEGGKGLLRE